MGTLGKMGLAGALLVALVFVLWLLSKPAFEADDSTPEQDYQVLERPDVEADETGRRVIDAHSHLFNAEAWPNILAVME